MEDRFNKNSKWDPILIETNAYIVGMNQVKIEMIVDCIKQDEIVNWCHKPKKQDELITSYSHKSRLKPIITRSVLYHCNITTNLIHLESCTFHFVIKMFILSYTDTVTSSDISPNFILFGSDNDYYSYRLKFIIIHIFIPFLHLCGCRLLQNHVQVKQVQYYYSFNFILISTSLTIPFIASFLIFWYQLIIIISYYFFTI